MTMQEKANLISALSTLRVVCENKNSYGYCKTTYCINPIVRMGGLDHQLGFTAGYAQAKAEVKHGRWKQIAHPWYECSECGERTAVVNLNGKVLWHYCPNCGARMDGGENGSCD